MYIKTSLFAQVTLLSVIYTAFSGCVDRQHENPLDPRNEETNGRPSDVRVLSIQDTVFLGWDQIELSDLTGFQVYRKAARDSLSLPISQLPPNINFFADTTVDLGTEYTYEISAIGTDYESPRSFPVTITPGPTFTWVASGQNGFVFKFTHDSRHQILSVGPFLGVTGLEADPRTGFLWVIERFSFVDGSATLVSPEGVVTMTRVQFTSPEDSDIDAATGALWVADSRAGEVVKVNTPGNVAFSVSDIANPVSVSVDQGNGSCWVVSRSLNRAARVGERGGVFFSTRQFTHLKAVSVDHIANAVWVSDSTRVFKLSSVDGSQLLESGVALDFASKLAADPETGDVWVLDRRAGKLLKLTAAGTLRFAIEGLFLPEALALNRFDGACLVADTRNSRLLRVSADGQQVISIDDAGFPTAIAVQNEPLSR